MPLTCECPYDDESTLWFYEPPDDFSTINTKRRRRCSSCNALIDNGALCLCFKRWRFARGEYEENRFGDGSEISLASMYFCEHCGEIYLNLDALKYCVYPGENMNEILSEYHAMTGFKSVEVK